MNDQENIITAAAEPAPLKYVCPKHPTSELWGLLKGGAGFCRACNLYTQAKDVPMPVLPPKPERVKVKRARKAKVKAPPAEITAGAASPSPRRARLIKRAHANQ